MTILEYEAWVRVKGLGLAAWGVCSSKLSNPKLQLVILSSVYTSIYIHIP